MIKLLMLWLLAIAIFAVVLGAASVLSSRFTFWPGFITASAVYSAYFWFSYVPKNRNK